MEGLIYGGKFAFQNRLGLFVVGRKFIIFFFVLLCIRGQIPSTSPPGGLYSERRFNRGFFGLRFWGAYTLRGLFSEFYGMFSYDVRRSFLDKLTKLQKHVKLLVSKGHLSLQKNNYC